MRRIITCLFCFSAQLAAANAGVPDSSTGILKWEPLPDLPDSLGVAGPFVGTHNGALVVAGGANFPVSQGQDRWQVPKIWHDRAWVLVKRTDGQYEWLGGFQLNRPIAYGACATTKHGVVCIGGNAGENTYSGCFLLTWDPSEKKLRQIPLPSLPEPCAYGAAAAMGDVVYLAGGQSGPGLETAGANFRRLDLSKRGSPLEEFAWEKLPSWPGPSRAFNLTVTQHNGFDDCIYVISGRRQNPDGPGREGISALADVYEFNPRHYDHRAFDSGNGSYRGSGQFAAPWRRRSDVPHCVMAGSGFGIGQSHIFILSGADGTLFGKAEELKDNHPGFPRRALAYHTITDTWIVAGASPSSQVTTPAVMWDGKVVIASGEVRPRVRARQVWAVEPVLKGRSFGAVNFTVLIVYLLGMVGVGVYFAKKNRDTNDYFRGGQKILWWVAGCSIFATMLSSITYMAIPAKAFAQDLVYLIGNMMIVAVAPISIYLALPFFRRIDATSAYEYLEKRFNLPVRLFASASFTIFHIFRMGIVMSLAGLALATITPLTPAQCVLLMGVLSIIYCTVGGVGAVVWTDTIQTFVLLGGALLCFGLLISGSEGGLSGFLGTAAGDGKLHTVNLHWDPTSASLALWVVVIGAIGQNISSYTADQAVVQRYMTTPDIRRAAGSIWTAAILSAPASLLFFFLGTALYVFYKSHPEKLDPTYMTDQIFPLFISQEVPAGIAGLIVAGIFAAAQSTISTSMNSTATAVVTDFMRPFGVMESEKAYLNWARGLTFCFGLLGTLLGLLFVNPEIKSLFDSFLKVIGLFMGVLGGLFLLGVLTRRASGWGALIGALAGASIMGLLPIYSRINGYLYAFIGVTCCFIAGYLASLFLPAGSGKFEGLNLFTLKSSGKVSQDSSSRG